MTGRLARLALRLYPLAYRRRYGEEMRALLDDRPPRPHAVLDLLRGALVAHLRPADAPASAVGPADRARLSASAVLMCWLFFAAAGFGYYKTTEDQPFSIAGRAHPLLRDAHLAVQVLAVIASAVVVLGALPLIGAALVRARREAAVRRQIARAVAPLVVFAVLTAAMVVVAHAHPGHRASGAGSAVAVVWGVAGLACGAACVLACRATLFALPVAPARLRGALAAGVVLTAAMLVIAIATAVYAVALAVDSAPLAASGNGPYQLLSVLASLVIQVLVMAGATALAASTLRRGWYGFTPRPV